jgi:hypothetical protein
MPFSIAASGVGVGVSSAGEGVPEASGVGVSSGVGVGVSALSRPKTCRQILRFSSFSLSSAPRRSLAFLLGFGRLMLSRDHLIGFVKRPRQCNPKNDSSSRCHA